MSGQARGGSSKGAGKVRVAYVCNACGARLPKWAGQCPDCGGWNCIAEVPDRPAGVQRRVGYAGAA